jgi:predicted enzyme involved in methoxymalonyl-ACP biosynthesis
MIEDTDDFHEKLKTLLGEVHHLPGTEQEKLKALTEATRARQEKLKKTVHSLQESLDYLRVSVKYLVFDLEATRRENDYLRKLLADRQGES